MKIELKDKGFFYIPDLFEKFIRDGLTPRLLKKKKLQNLNYLIKELRSSRPAVIEKAPRKDIEKLFAELEKRADELICFEDRENINSRSFSRNRKRAFDNIRNDTLSKIFIICGSSGVTSFGHSQKHLLSLCGVDPYDENISEKWLIPYSYFRDLETSLNNSVKVNELGVNISSGNNVLLPRSQETTELFAKAFEDAGRKNMNILDVGCGSGVLTMLAHKYFKSSNIYFTDILPEATASTMLNLHEMNGLTFETDSDGRLSATCGENRFYCCRPGDLFENINGKFDIMIFNPPWVDSTPLNRSELALNDKGRKTLRRFFAQAKYHLSEDGVIIIAFSDNSGEKAVADFEEAAKENGLKKTNLLSQRVQSYQSGRKWMKIFVYILKKGDGNEQ